MTTLLIGATGLVGSLVVRHLEGRDMSVLVRRPMDSRPPHVREYLCKNSNEWPKRIRAIKPQRLICCVGTTMKKSGGIGGQVQFRAVDQDLVLGCALYARRSGARHMIVITSVGATDRVDNIYLNAKGIVERELGKMAFDRLDIIRPGLLLGDRSESRPAESVGKALAPLFNPLLVGGLRKFRAIPAGVVARAILGLAEKTDDGHFIHHYDDIVALAG